MRLGSKQGSGWRYVVVAFILGGTLQVSAQTSAQPSKAEPNPKATPASSPAKSMDTGESLGFMGKSLWFEVRRRLNLTTEEEEKKHKEEAKELKLKVGGLRITRDAPSATPAEPAPKQSTGT
ncbi:MAG: hypothetical protein WAT74_12400 [Flavobacteriales bacterium]